MKDMPLYKQIQRAIKAQIALGNLRPGDRIPSEKELAEQFHVSLITTKNALSGLADEGVVVRAKGKGTFVAGEAAFGLRMPPAGEAATGKPFSVPAEEAARAGGMIGMIIPSMRTKVEQRLLDGIESAVNERGYTLVIRVSRGSAAKERESIAQLRALGIAGLILFPIGAAHERQTVDTAIALGCPLVLIDRYYADLNVASVSSDNRAGARMAVAHLAGEGHRQLALLTPPPEHSVVVDRLAGIDEALAEQGIAEASVRRLTVPYERFNVPLETATDALEEWMRLHHAAFAAIVAVDVELARAAYRALVRLFGPVEARRKRIVTFDDPEIEGIAYIRQAIAAIGERAVALLMEQLRTGAGTRGQHVVPMALMTSP
ncbi:GntR family transcriptional regulator [Paenibacillus methanolicus]|uniref:DNA-binding LacI/PurR family transcriptional regulator n=1 Tax=Paenibacillus methanolicus TaxID=582686 RepID=A0A5S5CGH5_9BACL|nr:GntR family transcriptional regulator [Paenibacillus methanolicus]TYP78219.1 DNA-binding LacI/PurR family transcriptional regulator [Paenibacillus methanolicus]